MLGTAKLNAGEYEVAIADFEKAAELNPNLPDVYSYLGRAHIETGDTAAARQDFQKELQQNPNDFESNLNLGALLKQDQDYDGARKLLDRALRVRPGDLRARFQLASVNLGEGQLDEARTGLEQIVKQAPEFVEAHISLATAYYRLQRKADGDREKALAQKLAVEQRSGQSKEKTNEARAASVAVGTCADLAAGALARPTRRTAPRVPVSWTSRRRSKIPYKTNNSFAGRKYFPAADVRRRRGIRFRQRRHGSTSSSPTAPNCRS